MPGADADADAAALEQEQAVPRAEAAAPRAPAALQALAASPAEAVPRAETEAPPARDAQSGLAPPAHPASPWFPVDPDDETQPIAAISAPSGGKVNPAGDVTIVPPGRERPGRQRPVRERPGRERPGQPGAWQPSASRRYRRYRMAGVFALAGIVLAAGSLAFTLSRHAATRTAGNVHPVAVAERATRDRAASWVASQVSAATIVSCDPLTCQDLRAHGVPAASLLRLRPGRTDPLRSDVIVATAVVRGQLGGRLGSVYAPAVIASFGSGNQRIDIRVIARHGAAAYLSSVRADVLARQAAAVPLLRSQRVAVSAAARTQLADGQVDTRLLVTLAGLAAIHPISILAFGDSAPGASTGMPLRSADVAAAGAAGTRNSPYLQPMIGFLRSQGSPYLPAHLTTVRLAGGQAVLRIEFAAPSLLRLLG